MRRGRKNQDGERVEGVGFYNRVDMLTQYIANSVERGRAKGEEQKVCLKKRILVRS